MRTCLLCALLVLAPCVDAAPAGAVAGPTGRWVVTLADAPAASALPMPATADAEHVAALVADAETALLARQAQWLAAARHALGRELVAELALQRVANALVLTVSADEAGRLAGLPGVVAVEPDHLLPLAGDVVPGFVGATAVWDNPALAGRARGEGVVVGVLDSGVASAHRSFADLASDGYDHVNPRGIRYGLCIQFPARCNDKLIGLYDFTSEGNRDGSDAVGHGTHVAAIAVGNPLPLPAQTATAGLALTISGVAPRAALISYKVCTRDANDPNSSGTCPFSAILAGLEQAARDLPDVVNYSIGGNPRDPWSAVRGGAANVESAFLNLRALGVLPVAAAGNEGPGAGTVQSAGNAPWVLAVANTNHDRLFGARLAGIAGSGPEPPFDLIGATLTGGLARRPLVLAADFGHALCGTGPSEGVNPTGASNPFAPGTFSGQIVVCQRGTYARVEKGYNVRAAGAGGYVLVNAPADGEGVVADTHFLPAVHLGLRDGRRLVTAISTARAAGDTLSASIGPVARESDPARADRLNASSSRGPVQPFGGWAKPDLAAPGTSILSAAPSGVDAVSVRTGTSMASPVVAGAAALLKAARPGWSADDIASALVTTAGPAGTLEDAVTPATPLERGAGRVAVDRALRAGLSMRVGLAGFRDGDPMINGAQAPARMNLPGIVLADCAGNCSVQRRVQDLVGGGSWSLQARMPAGVRAEIASPTLVLAGGGSADLSVRFLIEDAVWLGRWVHGELALVPDNAMLVEQRLPVSLFASAGQVPSRIDIDAAATSGHREITLQGLAALPDARFDATPLVRMQRVAATLPQDPTPQDPWDLPSPGVLVRELDVGGSSTPEGTYALLAEARSASARDIDLFVGRDDGDGVPEANERVCSANGPTPSERCRVDFSLAVGEQRRYWVLVQNHAGGAADAIELDYAAVARSGPVATADGSLVASGPGRTSGDPFALRLGWSLPAALPGERWLGFVGISATRSAPGAVASVLVDIAMRTPLARVTEILDPRGAPLALALSAGEAHERLIVDVPPGTGALTIESNAAAGGGDIDLWLVPSAVHAGDPPLPVAPPRSTALASAQTTGSNERIALSTLAPGRYHVIAANRGPGAQRFDLRVNSTPAGAPPRLGENLYFNPRRDGHGVFVSRGGGQLVLFWYTYDDAGAPTWYFAAAPTTAAGETVWSAPLSRSSWNGASYQLTRVGRVLVTRTADDRFVYAWQLDGSWGAEPLQPVAAPSCPRVGGVPIDYTGQWYSPQRDGYGFSVLSLDRSEVQLAYVYDAAGNPRWVKGLREPFGASAFDMRQFRGYCPQCPAVAISSRLAGTLVRSYASASTGNAALDLDFGDGVAGAWRSDFPTLMLTTPLDCAR